MWNNKKEICNMKDEMFSEIAEESSLNFCDIASDVFSSDCKMQFLVDLSELSFFRLV